MNPVVEIVQAVRSRAPQVTVIGDAILDRWVQGHVDRLSREGPVPVVDVAETVDRPGGAANTAANLAALGARVRLLSAVGDDDVGCTLRRLLETEGVDVTDVAVVAGRVTASKTRIVGSDQILVRTDVAATPGAIPEAAADAWRDLIRSLPDDESLVVCDYAGGLFDGDLPARLQLSCCRARVVVDAHDLSSWRGAHPDVVTPNAAETERLLDESLLSPEGRKAAVANRADELLLASGARAAVVTLDHDGAVVIERGSGVTHATTCRPAPEVQATGAGDAFAAALTVALGAGFGLSAASDFAQTAASVVVDRPGTAVCSLDDLERTVQPHPPAGIVSASGLASVLHRGRSRGTTVFVNGCFDLLHAGHAAHLEQARALGDTLVVAVNDDQSARRLKGPGRPVNAAADRARVVASLACVDFVLIFSEDSPLSLIASLKPDVYAKGGDYLGRRLPEMDLVEEYGGEVRILDFFTDHSTTSMVERIARTSPIARARRRGQWLRS